MKKVFSNNSAVTELAKTIISNWKKVCEVGGTTTELEEKKLAPTPTPTPTSNTKISSSSSSTSTSTSSGTSTSSASSSSSKILRALSTDKGDDGGKRLISPRESSGGDDSVNDEELYNKLSEQRRKIMDLLSEPLKSMTNLSTSNFIAYNIEQSIHKLHSAEYDSKNYTSKARSLIFNLKKNEQLRLDMLDGSLDPSELVFLSANELATDEKKKLREGEMKSGTLERRSDFMDITRNERMKSNGIDPNKGKDCFSFCCSMMCC